MNGSRDQADGSKEGSPDNPELEDHPSYESRSSSDDPEVDENLSYEGRASLRHPEVKEQVCSLAEFQEWFRSLPEVVVDDVKYYVRGGDMLKDTDEVLWEWARKNRPDLIPPGEE